jgi:hypothetical protein
MIWEGGQPGDFELTLKFEMTPGDEKKFTNSGIQYRSTMHDAAKWIVGGYQADFEYGETYSGILYEERGRGILAQRGQKVTLTQSDDVKKPKIEVTGETGVSAEIQAAIKKDDWNDYRIVAKEITCSTSSTANSPPMSRMRQPRLRRPASSPCSSTADRPCRSSSRTSF